MPTLFEQLDGVLGDIDISVTVDGELQKWVTFGETLAQLIDNPPDELSDYLSVLSEFELPEFDAANDVISTFNQIKNLIPDDIGDLNGDVMESLGELETSAISELDGLLEPLVKVITALQTLLQGDPTCGIIEGFLSSPEASPPETDDGEAPGGDGGGEGGDEEAPTPEPATTPTEQFSDQQVDDAKAMIDMLPEPLTVSAILPWLSDFWGNQPIPYNLLRAVPILDDIRGPLVTVSQWQSLSGDQILAQFAGTINQLAQLIANNSQIPVTDLVSAIDTELGGVNLIGLRADLDSLLSNLQTIQTAVDGADISGIAPNISAINTVLSSLQAHHTNWQTNHQVLLNQLLASVSQLPDELCDRLSELLSLLQPRPALADLFDVDNPLTPALVAPDDNPLQPIFDDLENFLMALLDAIDVSEIVDAVNEPLQTVTNSVGDINESLVGVTLEVKGRLDSLNGALDAVDLASLQADLLQAINDFTAQLTNELNSLFAPVREALEAIVTELDGLLDNFDPAVIQDAINDVIGLITSVFEDPNVKSALEQIGKLNELADNIESLSFTPLTDTVIDGIEAIDSALDDVGDDLSPPLSDMLDTAMSVLPRDLEPITDPLIARLGEIVEEGPVEFIEQIKEVPERVFNQISEFDPEALIGDSLSEPFNEILDKAEQFNPADLLEELEGEFDKLKEQLKNSGNPGQVLEPLVDIHRQVAQSLAQLTPGDFIEPLDQQIQSIGNTITEHVQIDEFLLPLSDVISTIRRQTDTLTKGLDVVNHLLSKLGNLGDPSQQIDDWLDALFDLIPDSLDITPIQAPLAALANAIDQSKSAAMQTLVTDQLAILSDQLDDLQPATALSQWVQQLAAIPRSSVEALPDSAEKTQLLDLLDQINPTDPILSGPINQYGQLQAAVADALQDINSKLTHWDQRFHPANGLLDQFNLPGADLTQIKTLLREAIDRQLGWPLKSLFEKIRTFLQMLESFTGLLQTLLDQLNARIEELLSVPESILDLGDSLQGIVDTIGTINLDFLQESINEIFDTVRDKFNALNPAPLKGAVDDAFAEAIDAVSFDLVVPADSLNTLNDTFDEVLNKLRTLDPTSLLVEPLQTAFDEEIQPIIESLDITPLFDAIIGRLQSLDEELKDEMGRVNTAYQAMLASAPGSSGGASVGI